MSIVIDGKTYSTDDVQELLDDLQTSNDDYAELEEQAEEYKKENEKLISDLVDFKATKEQHKFHMEDMKALNKVNKDLQNKIVKLSKGKGNDGCNDPWEKNKFLQERCDQYYYELQELKKSKGSSMTFDEKQKVCKTIKSLKITNESLSQKVSQLEQQNDNYFLQMNKYKDEIDPLKSRCEKSHENNEALRKEISELKKQKPIVDNINNNDDRDNIISTLKEEIAELKCEMKSKKSNTNTISINSVEIIINQMKEKVKEQMKTIFEENEKLKKDINFWREKFAPYLEGKGKCQILLETRNKTIKELNSKLSDYNDNTIQRKLEWTEKDLKELKEENEKLKKTNQELNDDIDCMLDNDLENKNTNNIVEPKITNTIETQTETRNTELNKENIRNVFDLVFKNKMDKKNNEPIYRKLMAHKTAMNNKVLSSDNHDTDKIDYSSEYIKYIIKNM